MYREKVNSTQNDKKQKASKGTLPIARKSLCLGGSVHGEDADNTNDILPDISHDVDHVQVSIDEDLVYSGSESCLQDLYLKLKQIFEGTSVQIGERASATPNVAINELIRPSAAKEKTHVVSTNMSSHSASPNLDLTEPIRPSTSKEKTTYCFHKYDCSLNITQFLFD